MTMPKSKPKFSNGINVAYKDNQTGLEYSKEGYLITKVVPAAATDSRYSSSSSATTATEKCRLPKYHNPRSSNENGKRSIGSRVRILLGRDSSEVLLLLNEDDGDMKWQTISHYYNSSGSCENNNNGDNDDNIYIPKGLLSKLDNQNGNSGNHERNDNERLNDVIDFDISSRQWYVHQRKYNNNNIATNNTNGNRNEVATYSWSGHHWWGNTKRDVSDLLQEMIGKRKNNNTRITLNSTANNGKEEAEAAGLGLLQVSLGCDHQGTSTHVILQRKQQQQRRGHNTATAAAAAASYWCCYYSDNINPDLKKRINELQNENKQINFIRLFNNNSYFISDEDGIGWSLVDEDGDVDESISNNASGFNLNEELMKEQDHVGFVEDIAISDDSKIWVVIRSNHFVIGNDDDDDNNNNNDGNDTTVQLLQNHLTEFFTKQKERDDIREEEIRVSQKQNEYEKQQWDIQRDTTIALKESAVKNKRHAIRQQTEEIANMPDDENNNNWSPLCSWFC